MNVVQKMAPRTRLSKDKGIMEEGGPSDTTVPSHGMPHAIGGQHQEQVAQERSPRQGDEDNTDDDEYWENPSGGYLGMHRQGGVGTSSGGIPTGPETNTGTPAGVEVMMGMMRGMMQNFQDFMQAQMERMVASLDAQRGQQGVPVDINREGPRVGADRQEQEGRGPQEEKLDIKAFQKMKPPIFQGERDYQVVDRWVAKMEKIFSYMEYTEEQKVKYDLYVMEGDAEQWWDAEKAVLPDGGRRLRWAEFLERFLAHYVPDSERTRRASEFMHLVQGKMTVEEYDAKFRSLSRFVPWIRTNPQERARKFQEGLKFSIRRGLTPFMLHDYGEMLDRARMIEREE